MIAADARTGVLWVQRPEDLRIVGLFDSDRRDRLKDDLWSAEQVQIANQPQWVRMQLLDGTGHVRFENYAVYLALTHSIRCGDVVIPLP